MLKIYKNLELIPKKWLDDVGDTSIDWYVFNPTITEFKNFYVMTYRVVDQVNKTRRIASCKIKKNLSIIPNSVTALSDLIEFENKNDFSERTLTWHADPRYFKLNNKLYVFWNDGSVKPTNHQFLVEIGDDGLTPKSKAKLVIKEPKKEGIEKNWQFFSSNDNNYVIYENRPLSILEADINSKNYIACKETFRTDWSTSYEKKFGTIRGGAQPLLNNNSFLVLAHSSFKNENNRLIYNPCFYRFESKPPFKVTHHPVKPLKINVPNLNKRILPKLNKQTDTVIYPCGIIINADEAIISFGINDELCAITKIKLSDIEKTMVPIETTYSHKREDIEDTKYSFSSNEIPLFWWNAKGKKFDHVEGNRIFRAGNVGDIASKMIFEKISGLSTSVPKKGERKVLSIGSILQTAMDGDVVWGSGVKGGTGGFKNNVNFLDVRAVRGPLTKEFLAKNGIDVSKIKEFFDPGCLIPYLYAQEISTSIPKKRELCIIPHYRDDFTLRKQYPNLVESFLSVDDEPLDFIKKLKGAELVISSSLHGIIFAESLGIPAKWLATINGEDELKYYDYYYGTDRYNVKRFASIEDALKGEVMELPIFNFEQYIKTFPDDLIASKSNGQNPDSLNENIKYSNLSVRKYDAVSPSFYLTNAILNFRQNNVLEGFLDVSNALMQPLNESEIKRIDEIVSFYTGIDTFYNIFSQNNKLFRKNSPFEFIRYMIVDFLHFKQVDNASLEKILKVLKFFESEKPENSISFKLIEAYIHFISADYQKELLILKSLIKSNSIDFWKLVQDVYRFKRSAKELTDMLISNNN